MNIAGFVRPELKTRAQILAWLAALAKEVERTKRLLDENNPCV